MAYTKAPHHRGTHHQRSAKIRAAAYANPSTRCWRCGLTLAEVRVKHPRAKWTAGHLIDGQVDGPMLPEDSWCNYSHGARIGNAQRNQRHVSAHW